MKKFLIVEDTPRTAQSLQKGLKEHHYQADIALDGEEALSLLKKHDYELIVLDVMLPRMDGWQLLKAIRQQDLHKPVLMLTALNDVNDRVRGLQAGADDYLAKPFAFSEFLARIEALLRRSRPIVPKETFTVAELTINMTTHSVQRNHKRIDLTPKEFQLLCMLAEHTGRFVSRKDLAERVWNIHFDCETNVVDVAIRRLRQKIDDGFPSKLIHTVRGVGYVLEQRSRFSSTIAFRMAASLALTSATLLILLCGGLYSLMAWQLTQEDNRFMDDVAALLQTTLSSQENRSQHFQQQLSQELTAFHYHRYQVRVVSKNGAQTPLFQSPAFPREIIPGVQQMPASSMQFPSEDGKIIHLPDGRTFLALVVESQLGANPSQPVLIQVALDISPKIKMLDSLRAGLLLLIATGVALFSLMGTWLVRRGLQPLHQFGQRIQHIRMESLDERMQSQTWPMELHPLAESFDRLLTKLEKYVDQITRFSGDLAHELRTPITGLRVETEVLLEKARNPDEYRAAMENNLLELERLSSLIERTLLLAKVDSPQFALHWQLIPARHVIQKLVGFYSLLAEEKQIALAVEGDVTLKADPQLFEQAVGNLISNAIKYTPPQGKITIHLFEEVNDAGEIFSVVAVYDTGYGIPEEQLQHVFERFYRGDPSRSKIIEGDGLGLAIVQSIMDSHSGKVTVESVVGQGSCFKLSFQE